uniref:transcription factor HIVEP3-like n=1 Tax=Myxine glutinosa TaxID=7769 RepID=UPI00358E172C
MLPGKVCEPAECESRPSDVEGDKKPFEGDSGPGPSETVLPKLHETESGASCELPQIIETVSQPLSQTLPPPPPSLPSLSVLQQSQRGPRGGGQQVSRAARPGRYVCTYCGRACAKPSVLQKHLRSHTGERPYPCLPCGFAFKTKSNLYKHRKSHAHVVRAGLPSSSVTISGGSVDKVEEADPEATVTGESTDSGGEEELGPISALSISPSFALDTEHPCRRTSVTSHSLVLTPVIQGHSPRGPEPTIEHCLPGRPLSEQVSVRQRLAWTLRQQRKALGSSSTEEGQRTSTLHHLGRGSKGSSTDSGYLSHSESAASGSSFGSFGSVDVPSGAPHATLLSTPLPPAIPISTESLVSPPSRPPVERQFLEEHIAKLIMQNTAVVEDTEALTSVKPRRSGRSTDVETQACTLLETPLTRSLSVPTTAGHPLHSLTSTRTSHSLDESSAPKSEPGIGLLSHHRPLVRQAAIEVPSTGTAFQGIQTTKIEEPTAGPSGESSRRRRKGSMYECSVCGVKYRKAENYAAHCKFYCSEFHAPRMSEVTTLGHSGTRPQLSRFKFIRQPVDWPPCPRKQQQEQSIGKVKETSLQATPLSGIEKRTVSIQECSKTMLTVAEVPTHTTVTPSSETAATFTTPFERTSSPKTAEGKIRGTGISVIQHTKSFEQVELKDAESLPQDPCKDVKGVSRPLGDGGDIQVSCPFKPPPMQFLPEIVVTVDTDVAGTHESGFRWPQRSESLSRLPTEKLPPKKKRLRLVGLQGSSQESSAESSGLSRSESSLSRGSSLDPDETTSGPQLVSQPSGSAREFLAVPPNRRPPRRSSSEQGPQSQQSSLEEQRSHSLDSGDVLSTPHSRVRQKAILTRQPSLSCDIPMEDIRMAQPLPSPSMPTTSTTTAPPLHGDFSLVPFSTSIHEPHLPSIMSTEECGSVHPLAVSMQDLPFSPSTGNFGSSVGVTVPVRSQLTCSVITYAVYTSLSQASQGLSAVVICLWEGSRPAVSLTPSSMPLSSGAMEPTAYRLPFCPAIRVPPISPLLPSVPPVSLQVGTTSSIPTISVESSTSISSPGKRGLSPASSIDVSSESQKRLREDDKTSLTLVGPVAPPVSPCRPTLIRQYRTDEFCMGPTEYSPSVAGVQQQLETVLTEPKDPLVQMHAFDAGPSQTENTGDVKTLVLQCHAPTGPTEQAKALLSRTTLFTSLTQVPSLHVAALDTTPGMSWCFLTRPQLTTRLASPSCSDSMLSGQTPSRHAELPSLPVHMGLGLLRTRQRNSICIYVTAPSPSTSPSHMVPSDRWQASAAQVETQHSFTPSVYTSSSISCQGGARHSMHHPLPGKQWTTCHQKVTLHVPSLPKRRSASASPELVHRTGLHSKTGAAVDSKAEAQYQLAGLQVSSCTASREHPSSKVSPIMSLSWTDPKETTDPTQKAGADSSATLHHPPVSEPSASSKEKTESLLGKGQYFEPRSSGFTPSKAKPEAGQEKQALQVEEHEESQIEQKCEATVEVTRKEQE